MRRAPTACYLLPWLLITGCGAQVKPYPANPLPLGIAPCYIVESLIDSVGVARIDQPDSLRSIDLPVGRIDTFFLVHQRGRVVNALERTDTLFPIHSGQTGVLVGWWRASSDSLLVALGDSFVRTALGWTRGTEGSQTGRGRWSSDDGSVATMAVDATPVACSRVSSRAT